MSRIDLECKESLPPTSILSSQLSFPEATTINCFLIITLEIFYGNANMYINAPFCFVQLRYTLYIFCIVHFPLKSLHNYSISQEKHTPHYFQRLNNFLLNGCTNNFLAISTDEHLVCSSLSLHQ